MPELCSLCDLGLANRSQRPLPGDVLDWREEIRAIRPLEDTTDALVDTQLTGVGFLEWSHFIFPVDIASSYSASAGVFHRYDVTPNARGSIFLFHEACWVLLLEQVNAFQSGNTLPNPGQVAQQLFNLLHCLPTDQNRRARIPIFSYSFSWAAPSIPAFRPSQRQLSLPWHTSSPPISGTTSSAGKGSPDWFAGLPSEIVLMVANVLSVPDLCNVRLSSRTWAYLTAPNSLPQSFWRSRFALDREMGYLGVAFQVGDGKGHESTGYDWRGLYLDVRHALRNPAASWHFYNRERIWRELHRFTDCLVLLVEQLRSLQQFHLVKKELKSLRYEIGRVVQGRPWHDIDLSEEPRNVGFRLFGMDYMLLDLPASEATCTVVEIRVSFITYDSIRYLCGLRVLERRRDGPVSDGLESGRTGLVVPSSETILRRSAKDSLTGIRVASSISGIVGIAFCFRGEGGHESILSAGVIQDLPEGVGIGTLRPREGRRAVGMTVGFDACKAVTVYLIEEIYGPLAADQDLLEDERQPRLGQPDGEFWDTQCPIWHPAEPTSLEGIPAPVRHKGFCGLPDSRVGFLVNMDFGSPDGARLSSLIRVATYHDYTLGEYDNLSGSIRGIEFVYSDGTTRSFNINGIMGTSRRQDPAVEQAIAIDGPGGERIVDIQYGFSPSRSLLYLRRIKMTTNKDRALDFRCDIKTALLHSATKPQGSKSLEAVAGIVARADMGNGFIHSLGIYGRSSHDDKQAETNTKSSARNPTRQLVGVDRILEEFPSTRDELRRSPNAGPWKLYTGVMLTGVRNVRISAGCSSKVRKGDHISGLCFEFFDYAAPVYVGQWFRQVAVLRLDPGERISELSIWETRQWGKAGKIAAIKIVAGMAGPSNTTSHRPREVEVCYQNKDNLQPFSFRENPYERLGSILWGFNQSTDFIQVATRPPASHPRASLVLEDIPNDYYGTQNPEKLYWEEILYEGLGGRAVMVPASRVQVAFDRSNLTGLFLEYEGGKVARQAGSVYGEGHRRTFDLQEGEKLRDMNVFTTPGNKEEDAVTVITNRRSWKCTRAGSETHHFDEADWEKLEGRPGPKMPCVGIWLLLVGYRKPIHVVQDSGPIVVKDRGSTVSASR